MCLVYSLKTNSFVFCSYFNKRRPGLSVLYRDSSTIDDGRDNFCMEVYVAMIQSAVYLL